MQIFFFVFRSIQKNQNSENKDNLHAKVSGKYDH